MLRPLHSNNLHESAIMDGRLSLFAGGVGPNRILEDRRQAKPRSICIRWKHGVSFAAVGYYAAPIGGPKDSIDVNPVGGFIPDLIHRRVLTIHNLNGIRAIVNVPERGKRTHRGAAHRYVSDKWLTPNGNIQIHVYSPVVDSRTNRLLAICQQIKLLAVRSIGGRRASKRHAFAQEKVHLTAIRGKLRGLPTLKGIRKHWLGRRRFMRGALRRAAIYNAQQHTDGATYEPGDLGLEPFFQNRNNGHGTEYHYR